jgi:hypothetical protein
VRVVAFGKTVVRQRTDRESGSAVGVLVPDHIDVIADMAVGAQVGPMRSWLLG